MILLVPTYQNMKVVFGLAHGIGFGLGFRVKRKTYLEGKI
jgi:hypothetical protein